LIEPTTLRIQRLLPGPIERIWAYLTDSDLRSKWLAAGAMEMKVGAPVEFVWRNDELNDPPSARPAVSRRAQHAEPHHRARSAAQAFDRLEQQRRRDVRAGAEGQGRAAHRDPSRLPDRSTMLKVSAGWHMHLDVLVARASGKEPAPFWEGWAACSRNTTAGCRPDAAHATSIATNRRLAMQINSCQRRSGKPRASNCS
jgi:uncharacterized protein YndB with AHSA1/START domain